MAVLLCCAIRFACGDHGMFQDACHMQRAVQRAVARRLLIPVSAEYKDATLHEICRDLQAKTGLRIDVDDEALRELGVDANHRFSLTAENISAKSTLVLAARKAQLCLHVTDTSVRITSEARTRGRFTTVSYPVADLFNLTKCQFDPMNSTMAGMPKTLVELIKTTIARDSWEGKNAGSIKYHRRDKSLIVHSYQDVHEQVGDLLAALRKLLDVTVKLDVRWVTVPPTASAIFTPTPESCMQGILLERGQVAVLLRQARQDCWGIVGPLSRRTLFNGQAWQHHLPDEIAASQRIDAGLALCPIVSADRRYVRLKVNGNLTRELPQGMTLGLHGGYHRKTGGPHRPVLILITSQFFELPEKPATATSFR